MPMDLDFNNIETKIDFLIAFFFFEPGGPDRAA